MADWQDWSYAEQEKTESCCKFLSKIKGEIC